jgi:hypothetical protein
MIFVHNLRKLMRKRGGGKFEAILNGFVSSFLLVKSSNSPDLLVFTVGIGKIPFSVSLQGYTYVS